MQQSLLVKLPIVWTSSFRRVRLSPMKKIAILAQKGGVGKTILDVRGIAPTVKIALAANKPTFFVLNRFPYGTARKDKVIKVLNSKYPNIAIAPICLIERPTYDASLEHGLGVIEFKPKSHAASDIKTLYRYLLKQMKECG